MNKNGVDIIDIYDKLYDEILFYVKNKNDFKVINFEDINIKENYLIDEFHIIDHIEEDNMDNFIQCKKYNHKENSVISFNVPIYLKENLKSYEYDYFNIWDQFEKDCPRSTIYINDILIHNEIQLRNELYGMRKHLVTVNNNMYNIITIIAMLCNQSSYAFPYLFLNKVQAASNSNIIAMNCSDNRSIKIKINNNNLKIWIDTDVNLRDISTGILNTKLHITLLIESSDIKTNKLENIFNKHGMFFINYSNK
jgi:hypothetical protein